MAVMSDEGSNLINTHIKQRIVEKFPIVMSALFDMPTLLDSVELKTYPIYHTNYIADQLLYELRAYLLKGAHKQMGMTTLKVPATWWQQFKLEVFPLWLLKRVTVKFKDVPHDFEKYIYICPHSDTPWPDEKHFQFMKFDTLRG